MTKTKIKRYSATLKNNCPVCYKDDSLQLTFFQTEKETYFYRKAEKAILGNVLCGNCNQTIFPIQYTKDMELVYDYHSKKVEAIEPKYKFKTPVFILLGIGFFAGISVIVLLAVLL